VTAVRQLTFLPPGRLEWRAVAAPLAERPGASVLVVGGLAQSVGLYAAAAARGFDTTFHKRSTKAECCEAA
jgi:hypothetical protein